MMTDVLSRVRPEIRTLAAYTPGYQPPPGSRVIKLNTNESPCPPSPAVGRALSRVLAGADILRRYPDPGSSELRAAAAGVYGCSPEQVLAGNGSDEILRILLDTFIDPGEVAAFFTPSYSLYPVLIRLRGGQPRAFPLRREGALYQPDPAGLKIFFLTSPNAPLGFSFSNDYIRELAAALDGILVVDEAYADFAAGNALPLLADCENLIVLRTFSKSYGLASLRVGLGFAAAPLIAEMDKVRDSYNLDRLAQAGALAALEDQDYLRKTVALVVQERERLALELSQIGFQVEPSQSNFLFVVPPAPLQAVDLYRGLEAAGILVRYFTDPRAGPRFKNYYRYPG